MGVYTTLQKDASKGISRVPLDIARIPEEDLIDMQKLSLEDESSKTIKEVKLEFFSVKK